MYLLYMYNWFWFFIGYFVGLCVWHLFSIP